MIPLQDVGRINKVMLKSGWDTLCIDYMVANINWMLESGGQLDYFPPRTEMLSFLHINSISWIPALCFGDAIWTSPLKSGREHVYNSCLEGTQKRHFTPRALGVQRKILKVLPELSFEGKVGSKEKARCGKVTSLFRHWPNINTLRQKADWKKGDWHSWFTMDSSRKHRCAGQTARISHPTWMEGTAKEKSGWKHREEAVKYVYSYSMLFE